MVLIPVDSRPFVLRAVGGEQGKASKTENASTIGPARWTLFEGPCGRMTSFERPTSGTWEFWCHERPRLSHASAWSHCIISRTHLEPLHDLTHPPGATALSHASTWGHCIISRIRLEPLHDLTHSPGATALSHSQRAGPGSSGVTSCRRPVDVYSDIILDAHADVIRDVILRWHFRGY